METGILFKSDAEEWLQYNQDMENRENPDIVPSLQYGIFQKDNGRLLGLLQIRLELKGYLQGREVGQSADYLSGGKYWKHKNN